MLYLLISSPFQQLREKTALRVLQVTERNEIYTTIRNVTAGRILGVSCISNTSRIMHVPAAISQPT